VVVVAQQQLVRPLLPIFFLSSLVLVLLAVGKNFELGAG